MIPPKDKNELTKPYKTIFGDNLTKQNFSSTKSPQEQDGQFAPHPHNSFPPYTHLVSRGKKEKRNPVGFYARLCSWLGQVGIYFQNGPPLPRHGHYPTQKSTLIRPQSGKDFYL
jgi:hypothetical protein